MHKQPIAFVKLRTVPSQFSWVDQRLVRERYIDQLNHPACALYLFLGTVAEAQGLSFYADRSLCHRLSMTGNEFHQARQALIQLGLVAYRRPLYQVLALGEEDKAHTACPKADDEEVDIKAVFARIWEVLS